MSAAVNAAPDDADCAAAVAARLGRDGHVALPAAAARRCFDPAGAALSGPGWNRFAASWDALGPDGFMADGGRYRLRRHAHYRTGAADGTVQRLPHAPHFQRTEYNPLNGGVDRWFEPVSDEAGEGAALLTLLAGARAVFDAVLDPLAPGVRWRVEAHQFRILARPDEAGQPTPEGMHRDGVDYVLVTLIGRHNLAGGVTEIAVDGDAPPGPSKTSFTLDRPMDSVLLDDRRVRHGVTPVRPLDPSAPGHRDVLVLTFARG